jgi:hypothetical protein
MEQFSNILAIATAAVPPEYFYLPFDGGDGVYRERVYCYELYHQLRSRWPDDTTYRLTGEVDKASHPILAQFGADRTKPDLLVHRPGYMENYAVIEVKSAPPSAAGIRKDLATLSLFTSQAGYQRGIYLIYGEGADDIVAERIVGAAGPILGDSVVELWVHSMPGDAAIQVAILRGDSPAAAADR